jgi:phosphatidylserine decarboxylase
MMTNKFSRAFGAVASFPFPSLVQTAINTGYVKALGLDMSEFDNPSSYETLNALFTRSFIVPREFSTDPNDVISPVDALITECGALDEEKLLQIKGMEYRVSNLLTHYVDQANIDKVKSGDYVNFYLSPKDYHRYHAPLDMQVTKLIHVPGKLLPVNKPSLNKNDQLFVVNERVVVEAQTSDGKQFFLVMVGALNVGQMVFTIEPEIETNSDVDKIKVYEYATPKTVKKGDELGYFKMGSTVVAIFEKGMVQLETKPEENVKFAQTIAKLN